MAAPNGMIRGIYYIYTVKYDKSTHRNKVEKVQGYLYKKGKLTYGICKVKDTWVATETSTGLSIGMYAYKLKEFPALFTEWENNGKLATIEMKVLHPSPQVKDALKAVQFSKKA